MKHEIEYSILQYEGEKLLTALWSYTQSNLDYFLTSLSPN